MDDSTRIGNSSVISDMPITAFVPVVQRCAAVALVSQPRARRSLALRPINISMSLIYPALGQN